MKFQFLTSCTFVDGSPDSSKLVDPTLIEDSRELLSDNVVRKHLRGNPHAGSVRNIHTHVVHNNNMYIPKSELLFIAGEREAIDYCKQHGYKMYATYLYHTELKQLNQ